MQYSLEHISCTYKSLQVSTIHRFVSFVEQTIALTILCILCKARSSAFNTQRELVFLNISNFICAENHIKYIYPRFEALQNFIKNKMEFPEFY